MLTGYVREINGERLYGVRRNDPTTGRLFCIRRTPDKTWEYSRTVKRTSQGCPCQLHAPPILTSGPN
jgi:hypothetical protein